jgi:PKD repeat protein
LDDGNVKLELWVDDGDETIDEGTRGAFRVDDSEYEFKKLSIREIVGSGEVADGALLEEGATAEEEAETGNLPTVEIISNGMEGVAPATFEFGAHITGGTESYTISWDFGDGSEVSDEENVAHTFEEPSRYNVAVTITDSNGETASDNLDVTVEEAAIEEREGGQETE